MNDKTEAIKALEYLIEEMKADRLHLLRFESSAPVKERVVKIFQDFKEFEQTGDFYIRLHFVREVRHEIQDETGSGTLRPIGNFTDSSEA